MKGVFDISGTSRYDDQIIERYHFPRRYFETASLLEQDWIVYRESRVAGGRMAYLAAAFVDRIEPDPADPTHFYARILHYQDFDAPVPYRSADGRFEERFLREMPSAGNAGRLLRGRSVRTLDAGDFASIVRQGLAVTLDPANRIRLDLTPDNLDPAAAELLAEPFPERRVEQVLLNRTIRDASFRRHVLEAYDNRCAVTGMRIVNGGGKAEAQAAHIWAVADGGPDVVRNGVALSATAHWLFDRHMISFDDDLRLLVSHNKVPRELLQLFPPPGGQIHLPQDEALRPHRDFVARHRSRFAGLGPA